VIDNFADEYLAGRTPNPCVQCNSLVKWDAFIDQADKLGAAYIATGHYANIQHTKGVSLLKKGKDPLKDQAYVLWGIPAHTLSRTLFPLGALTKKEVREIARDNNLETAEIPESMEICFVADNNYKRFLSEYAPDRLSKIGVGEIVDETGEVVGEHPGYPNYTIGQRKGLGLSNPEPSYVSKIDPESNRIIIGSKDSLGEYNCSVSQTNWLVRNLSFPQRVQAQIRYNSPVVDAEINKTDSQFSVQFLKPQKAVTPGQSIVFYDNDIILGGGVIEKNTD
jgi:tRNA-specific 2-thiouridylase